MKLELCDYESSQGLKEIGFDWNCEYAYYDDNIRHVLNTQIEEDYNSFVLNERGDNWEYIEKEYLTTLYDITKDINWSGDLPVPSLELAAKWFRDVYKIELSTVYGILCGKWMYGIYSMINNTEYSESDMVYKSYEQALQEGIKQAIKIIKNRKDE